MAAEGAPRSIHELVQVASYSDYNPAKNAYSLASLVRGVENLRRQAGVYEHEGDPETAFILLTRCAKLALEDIPHHPEYARADKAVSKQLIKTSKAAMESLKRLKPILKAAYDAHQVHATQVSLVNQLASTSISSYDSRDAGSESYDRLGRKQHQQPLAPSSPFYSTKPAKKQEPAVFPEPRLFTSSQSLPSLEARHSVPPSSASSSTGSPANAPYIPFAAPLPPPQPTREQRLAIPTSYLSSPFYTPFLDQVYAVPGPASDASRHSSSSASSVSSASTSYSGAGNPYAGSEMWHRRPVSYPSIPVSAPASSYSASPNINTQQSSNQPYAIPVPSYQEERKASLPNLIPHPPANRLPDACTQNQPIRPEKVPLSQPATRHLPYQHAPSPQQPSNYPSISRSDTLASLRGLARTEAGLPLRNLVLPAELVDTFAAVALPYTRRNLETCALIMGRLSRNTFTATLLFFPKQTATSDTCTTTNEEDIFEITDKRDVIVMGWIHSHPRQSCFLSSLDLHTHFSYQQMLPEAVAIVVAPTANPSVGIFRITDPPGLGIIGACDQKPTFHPHPEPKQGIYTDATAFHVKLQRGLRLEVVDVRR